VIVMSHDSPLLALPGSRRISTLRHRRPQDTRQNGAFCLIYCRANWGSDYDQAVQMRQAQLAQLQKQYQSTVKAGVQINNRQGAGLPGTKPTDVHGCRHAGADRRGAERPLPCQHSTHRDHPATYLRPQGRPTQEAGHPHTRPLQRLDRRHPRGAVAQCLRRSGNWGNATIRRAT